MNLSIVTKFCKKKLVPVWENSLRKICKAEKHFSSALIQQLGGGCLSDVEVVALASTWLPCPSLVMHGARLRQAADPAIEWPHGMPMGTLRGWGRWAVLSHPVQGAAWKVQMWLEGLQNLLLNCGGCYRGFLRGKKENSVSRVSKNVPYSQTFLYTMCLRSISISFGLGFFGTAQALMRGYLSGSTMDKKNGKKLFSITCCILVFSRSSLMPKTESRYIFWNKLIPGSCKNHLLSDAGSLKLLDIGYLQKFS